MRVSRVWRHGAKKPSDAAAVVQDRIERVLSDKIEHVGNAMAPFAPESQLILTAHFVLAIFVGRAYGEERFGFTQGLKDLCGIHGKSFTGLLFEMFGLKDL